MATTTATAGGRRTRPTPRRKSRAVPRTIYVMVLPAVVLFFLLHTLPASSALDQPYASSLTTFRVCPGQAPC